MKVERNNETKQKIFDLYRDGRNSVQTSTGWITVDSYSRLKAGLCIL